MVLTGVGPTRPESGRNTAGPRRVPAEAAALGIVPDDVTQLPPSGTLH
jgi:hypothetical protein